MAESAGNQATPSFKLVLVGDGGTGKVRLLDTNSLHLVIKFYSFTAGFRGLGGS